MRGLTLDRYVLSELGLPFSLAIGGLLFVLMTREMTRVTELLVMHGVSALVVLKLVVYILPTFRIVASMTPSKLCCDTELTKFSRLSFEQCGVSCLRKVIEIPIHKVMDNVSP